MQNVTCFGFFLIVFLLFAKFSERSFEVGLRSNVGALEVLQIFKGRAEVLQIFKGRAEVLQIFVLYFFTTPPNRTRTTPSAAPQTASVVVCGRADIPTM